MAGRDSIRRASAAGPVLSGAAPARRGAVWLLGLALLLLPSAAPPASAGPALRPVPPAGASTEPDEAVPEYVLKAAFLFNFARYTEWPAATFSSPEEPFIFAVLGADPFGSILDDLLAGKEIQGRKVVLRRHATLDALERCHVLFLGRSMERHLKEVLKTIQEKNWSVFTVAEFHNFARDGGTARLFLQNLQVRFEINLDAAARSRLKISSQLLKLAVILRDK